MGGTNIFSFHAGQFHNRGINTITGNHTNGPAGTHYLLIQGLGAGSGFPQTPISGTGYVSGALVVNFPNGFKSA